MLKIEPAVGSQKPEPPLAGLGERGWAFLLCLVCALVLLHSLGGAALFEPDEGRNAEKAREILVLNDWVTPYQNFLPTLDKPIFYYWWVALSFKVFGINEWSARLPSVASAAACLLLVYGFARARWGIWEALWSCLVLATSIEFFALSRVVIFDMTLTLFTTCALVSFYTAQQSQDPSQKSRLWLLMYAAMAVATLVKGLIGLLIPGMVIFCYLLFTRKWFLLRRMRIFPGAMLFLAIALPWYLAVEARNPGYLRYFFWEEHFVRYLTPHFNRAKHWYYFLVVLGVGFLPWSLILPATVRSVWKEFARDVHLFLVLWVVVPFVFFSASDSQLPHYILPIFPALALLTGRALGMQGSDIEAARRRRCLIILFVPATFVVYLLAGAAWPALLPVEIRSVVMQRAGVIGLYAAILLVILAVFIVGDRRRRWLDSGAPFLSIAVSLAFLLVLLAQIVAASSFHRVGKPLAQQLSTVIEPGDQLVFYSNYVEGILFYLRADKPIWLVQSREKADVMGSYYVGEYRPAAKAGYGPVLFTFEEFAEQWKRNRSLRVLLKQKNLPRFSSDVKDRPRTVGQFGDYLLVAKR